MRIDKYPFLCCLLVYAAILSYAGTVEAAPGCPIAFGRSGPGGTFPGVGPGHPGIGMPPFGTGGWPGAGGWGEGDVIEISKRTLPDPNLPEPAGELARTEEREGPSGGDGNQGIINLIPAIIGIIGGASGRGIPSGGSRGSSSRPAPSQKCHTSPDGTVHCGSN